MIILEGSSRRSASSIEQSRGQKGQSNIKSNVLDDSTDNDKYQEEAREMEDMKYLKGKLLPLY